MPCTIVTEYKDYIIERNRPEDTAPSFITPIDYTLEIVCTELHCGHPPKLAENLVLDFEEQGASWTHHGASCVARPIGEEFTYLGPLEDDTQIREGTLIVTSERGWLSITTTTGRTTGRGRGGRVEDSGSTDGGEETSSNR